MATPTTAAGARSDLGSWLLHGLLGGILAGIVFAMFEMLVGFLQMGGEGMFMPLRMIGGMVLGEQALDPATSLLVAGTAGVIVHMVLSAMYGVLIALVAAVVPALRSATVPLVAWAMFGGFALWILNFYVVAPIAGWNWFPQETDPLIQFIAHTFVFGALLGIYLDRTARTD